MPHDAIVVISQIAEQMVAAARAHMPEQYNKSVALKMVVMIADTDIRITIESSPKIAALGAIEKANQKAEGTGFISVADSEGILQEASKILMDDAKSLKEAHCFNGVWVAENSLEKIAYDRYIRVIKGLSKVERIV